MLIRQITVYQSPIRLKEPFIISLGPLYVAENILIVIQTDQGITGFGECSPFKTIHGESMDTCFVVAKILGEMLIGKNALLPEDSSARMDSVIYGNSSIKSAFDMALYDIASQHAGLPLYAFLGGKKDKSMFTDYTISLSDPVTMAGDALKIKQQGFTIIKVKLGGDLQTDFERIRLIRDAVGMDIPIRIDANQGWDTATAIELLNKISVFQIQHCEEPVPRWNFMELPLIRLQSAIPIMADESCFDHHDAQRLIQMKACDRINIKLGKSAGIVKALKIIRLAEQHGIPLQMGGFLESRLGFTAAAHLAQVSAGFQYFDFDTPLMFAEDPVIHGITYDQQGLVTLPERPGLGAEIDVAYLRSLKKSVIN